jgi:hypothetical protein
VLFLPPIGFPESSIASSSTIITEICLFILSLVLNDAVKQRTFSLWKGIPDDAFMILWLDKSTMNPVSGLAKYRDEFNAAI